MQVFFYCTQHNLHNSFRMLKYKTVTDTQRCISFYTTRHNHVIFVFPSLYCIVLYCIVLYCIVLYCIVSIHLYSASCSAHQSEALPVRDTQREESNLERTKRGTWLTS